jgi:hypothetical protein
MFERLFPSIGLKREQTRLAIEQTLLQRKLIESIPSFSKDDDEDAWSKLSGDGKAIYDENDITVMQEQALKIAYTPEGRCILDTMQHYIMGKNVRIMALDENQDVQDYWDTWAKVNKWDMRSKEIVKRAMRDGEVFVRFFGIPARTNIDNPSPAYNTIRCIDVNEIRDWLGDLNHSYGVECDPEDVEKPVNYYRTFRKQLIEEHEIIPADEIIHAKILVDSNVKRGISFLIGVAKHIRQYSGWLDDRVKLNKIRTIYNLIGNATGSGPLTNVTDKFENTTKPSESPNTEKKKMPKAGSVLVTRGIDWKFDALNINATDTKEDGRAIQLRIGLGTQLPEYIIRGDASNANYSSSMVSESPFVRMIEDYQDFFADLFNQIFQKVIRFGIESGEISAKSKKTLTQESSATKTYLGKLVKAGNKEAGKFLEAITKQDAQAEEIETNIECQVEFGPLIARNLKEETESYQIHKQNAWASDQTLSSKLGYDYKQEQAQIDKEDKANMERAKAADNQLNHPNQPGMNSNNNQSQSGQNQPNIKGDANAET